MQTLSFSEVRRVNGGGTDWPKFLGDILSPSPGPTFPEPDVNDPFENPVNPG